MPDVVNGIHQRCHSFEAETECEAGIDCWIDIARSKHIRVHHTRAAKLDPAGAFARAATLASQFARPVTDEAGKIKLGRRLREREVRRTKSRSRIRSEEPLQPFGNRAL